MTNEEIYDEGYKAGLEEAWELARKVVLEYDDGGMTVSDSDECFEIGNYYKILKRLSASEAKAKYDAWKKKKKQDAEPVIHGRWIYYPECLKHEGASHDDAICSVCGEMFDQMDNDVERFDYCPHCGAKMDAEQDE